MESDAERGFGSAENEGEELSPVLTIMSLNRGMVDSIVAKAGTLSTLENIKGIISFERKFKRAIDTTPFGCYPSMFLDVYEGTAGRLERDGHAVRREGLATGSRADGIDENASFSAAPGPRLACTDVESHGR